MYDFDKIIDRRSTRSGKWSDKNLLPLWVADMDFECPPGVQEAIIERAKHNLYGYDNKPENYNETLINWFEKHWDFKINEEWIVGTSGVVEALFIAIRALTVAGESVIIQPPVYHPFARSVLHSGRQLVNNALVKNNNNYEIDFDDLETKLADSFTKILILCNPHNPVGRVYTRQELIKIGELALKHDVIVVSDEIHGDLVYNDKKHISFASINQEFAQNSIICTAPSKTFNLAGLSASNIIIANKNIREKFHGYLSKRGLHGGNLYGFIACEAAYRTGEQWLKELLIYLENNALYLNEYLSNNLSSIKAEPLEGTYLQWIDCSELCLKFGLNYIELDKFIREKAGLWLSPGRQFGVEGSGYMRINIATPRKILNQALEQLKNAVNNL